MVLFVLQQLHDLLIISGKARLSGAALPEREELIVTCFLFKARAVNIDAVAAILRSSHAYQISLLQVAEFHHGHPAPLPHGYAIHAAFLCQMPTAFHLEIFRTDTHGMVAFGGHAVHGAGLPAGFGHGGKTGLGEIRPVILFNGKDMGSSPLALFIKL